MKILVTGVILSAIFLYYYLYIVPRRRGLSPDSEQWASLDLLDSLSLERRHDCSFDQPTRCFNSNKSLVISFWREHSRDKWLVKNILQVFPETKFDYVIMTHDNSTWWTSHSGFDKFIWIHVNEQMRFWYIKRFLQPSILKAYRYIWIVDDDAQLLFDPSHYECVIDHFSIGLSAPGRLEGVFSHAITQINTDFIRRTGRWTDFVEVGPIVVGSSIVWQCLWHHITPFVGLGWGLDLIWCKLISDKCIGIDKKACAILDVFHVDHKSNSIASKKLGKIEWPAYDQYYRTYQSNKENFGPLSKNLRIYRSCQKA